MDYALGTTIDVKFNTQDGGTLYTLAGSPTVAAYPDNSTTEITAGLTLTVDIDSRTGLHNIRVVASGGNGFAAGSSYTLVLTAGTVNAKAVTGYVCGKFTIEKESALRPTTAGRTLDVSATGEGDANVVQVDGAALDTHDAGSFPADVRMLAGSATPVTNMNTVFNTDFATNYNTTNDGWVVKLGDYAHGGSSATLTLSDFSATQFTAGSISVTSDLAIIGTFSAGTFTANITGNLSGSVGSVATNGISAASLAADAGTEIGTAVWASATRTLTAATNITSTGGTITVTSGGVHLANGAHGGAAAVITFERMRGASTTTNEPCIHIDGNGTGAGMEIHGGASGPGLFAWTPSATHFGIHAKGGGGGMWTEASGAGPGWYSSAVQTGGTYGFYAEGKVIGIFGFGNTVSSSGASFRGTGGGSGLEVLGGVTGVGLSAQGGSTSGHGATFYAVTDGHGIDFAGAGSGKDDIHLFSSDAPTLGAAVLAAGDVDGYSLEETLKLCLAALAGEISGAATTTVIIRAADDSKPRITATVDADGNRTALTLDETG